MNATLKHLNEKAEFYENKYKALVENYNLMKTYMEDLENFYVKLFTICHNK
jgi:hypothetical protein